MCLETCFAAECSSWIEGNNLKHLRFTPWASIAGIGFFFPSRSSVASNPKARRVLGGMCSISSSVRPQFNQIVRIPAFLAAGMAVFNSLWAALLPAPSAGRPKYVERKKFCMSMITRALLEGSMTTGLVVVERETESLGEGIAYSGGGGRVRSKVGGDEEYSQ